MSAEDRVITAVATVTGLHRDRIAVITRLGLAAMLSALDNRIAQDALEEVGSCCS